VQLGTATAKDAQSRADELEEHLIDFAVRIVRLSARLPKTAALVATSLHRFSDQERRPLQITVRREAEKAQQTSFISFASF
jgi:hypothetical protein